MMTGLSSTFVRYVKCLRINFEVKLDGDKGSELVKRAQSFQVCMPSHTELIRSARDAYAVPSTNLHLGDRRILTTSDLVKP